LASVVAIASVSFYAPPARACGGCFHEPTPPNQNASVVTDHRMAFSISTTQTVLWDQIRYSGNPANFAWVLPVGKGATIDLARDEWLAALDALSAPTIYAPQLPARCNTFGGGGGGGGFGCGASDSASFDNEDGGVANFDGGNGVTVISQEVVGPYLAVTISSSSGEAISTWLTDNGFDIPSTIQPVLDAYTTEGFDFIALKLAPNEGVNAMQPVRVMTPGADVTLPLRMVAAGIGQSVGLTLYVIGEGRYESSNFPALLLDRSKITWDGPSSQSNYAALFDSTVAAGSGWVTESSVSIGNLNQLYQSTCLKAPEVPVACADDGGVDDSGTDGGDVSDAADETDEDASTGDAATTDAMDEDDAIATSTDGGVSDADAAPPPCVTYESACTLFTDYTVATTSMSTFDIRVTRLRTTLPASALSVDLALAASSDQSQLSNTIQTTAYDNPNYDPCPNAPPQTADTDKEGCGCITAGENRTVTSSTLAALALASIARRRRRSNAPAPPAPMDR
jgi:hypothetical protein